MARHLDRSHRQTWIIDAVRTPIGRYGGALGAVRPDDLAALVIRAIVDRSGIDPAIVEDVILGCANQAGEDNRNVARMAALLAGLPVEVAGQTVNRLCGSGLQAVNSASHAIGAGDGDVFIAGGVESMTRAPYVMLKAEAAYERGQRTMEDTTLGWRFVNPADAGGLPAHLPGRDGRVRGGPVRRIARAPGRVRAREPAAGGRGDRGRAVRLAARSGLRSRPQGCRDGRRPRRAPPPRRDRGGARRPQAGRSARVARSPPATAPGSTTAPPHCSWPRRIGRASWACARWPGSSPPPWPACIPT